MTRQERTRRFRAALHTLSPREREVLSLRCKGMSNKGAGAQLFISDQTVKNTNTNVLRKLLPATGVETMTGLCFRLGYEMALLDVQKGIAELEEAA